MRVKCGVFKGDTRAVFVDRREFTGPIYEQIEEAHKYILSKINMGCVFEGIQRRDLYELPPDALRELVVNAFAHRNYFEHDAPIFVAVYDTRVEITSPATTPSTRSSGIMAASTSTRRSISTTCLSRRGSSPSAAIDRRRSGSKIAKAAFSPKTTPSTTSA